MDDSRFETIQRLKLARHGLPALLSFFLPGLGQLIKGQVLLGFLVWVAAAVAAVSCMFYVGFVLLPVLWVVQIYDAYVTPDAQASREIKRLSGALALIFACALAVTGCGSVEMQSSDGAAGGGGSAAGTMGAAGSGGGAGGTAGGAPGSGGSAAAGAGGCTANITTDRNNCGACGHVCPPAEMNRPNDSQQECYAGHCYVPSGDVCTTSSECITGYCQTGGVSVCNPKPCVTSSECPAPTPNCDDPTRGYARCTTSTDGGSSACICSAL